MSEQQMTPAEIERATVERCSKEADDWDSDCADRRDIAEAIRALPPMFGDVPAGWQLVPVEPTGEMLGVLTNVAARCNSWKEGYKAMLSAAPTAGQAAAKDAQDTARLEWMISEGCLVAGIPVRGGNPKYYVEWPMLNEAQRENFSTPREAIDAAMSAAPEVKDADHD